MQLDFEDAGAFRSTKLLRQADGRAYAYQTSYKSIDVDGAPDAYHPDDIGRDRLANAGYPHTNWWRKVLVPDPADPDRAFEQPGGRYAGYYVSRTSLRSPRGAETDPATYVDARTVPYIVLPTGFEKVSFAARMGDVGFATNLETGDTTAFIVGDSGGGSQAELGEASVAFFVALGGQDPNPRNGRGLPDGTIQYIVFPGSRRAGNDIWPRTTRDIAEQVQDLLATTPGISRT